jgi:phosphoribosyl-ATP pyrophosphohydrolase
VGVGELNKQTGKVVPLYPNRQATPAGADLGEIELLFEALSGNNLPPRTRKLSSATIIKKAKKLVEEASEVSFEAVFGRRRGVIEESADLIYHLVVLWRSSNVKPQDVWREMHDRAEHLGVAEKLPKRGKLKAARLNRA